VANVIDIVEAEHALPRLPVARALWKPRPDMRTAVEAWLSAGGTHHTVLSRALDPEPLADLAEMADVEFLLIDETSTVPAFRKELRWNQSYYHLARGL
jgi:L-arabinose isomerase